jgi:hypothetical protein
VKFLASLMIRYVEVLNMSSSINALVDEFQELPLVSYPLVFCHKKQEIFSASWRLCARHVFGCGYPR